MSCSVVLDLKWHETRCRTRRRGPSASGLASRGAPTEPKGVWAAPYVLKQASGGCCGSKGEVNVATSKDRVGKENVRMQEEVDVVAGRFKGFTKATGNVGERVCIDQDSPGNFQRPKN